MNSDILPWAPLGQSALKAVQYRLNGVLTRWSERWFADDRFSSAIPVFISTKQKKTVIANDWCQYGTTISVCDGLKQGEKELIDYALGGGPHHHQVGSADELVLSKFKNCLISDLINHLEEEFSCPKARLDKDRSTTDPLGSLGGLIVDVIKDDGTKVLKLALPYRIVAEKSRRTFTNIGTVPISRRLDALKGSHVDIEARLGMTQLPLVSLSGLAVGDVILLDKRLDQSIDVIEKGSQAIFAQGSVRTSNNYLAIQLSSSNPSQTL